MFNQNKNVYFLFYICTFILLASSSYLSENDLIQRELQRSHSISQNENYLTFLDRDIQIFFPEIKEEKFESDQTINNYRKIQNTTSKDLYIVPDNILQDYENLLLHDKIQTLITKSQKIDMKKFPRSYDIFAIQKNLRYDTYYSWHKLIKKNAEIQEFITSKQREFIEVHPTSLTMQLPICTPHIVLFEINNPNNDNLIIKSIKSDLYQIKILLYKNTENYNDNDAKYDNIKNIEVIPQISSYLPKTLSFTEKLHFQLVILVDSKRKTYGSLYIEFNDKKVLIISITIKGEDNKFKINPIYYPNWSAGKILSIPIKLYNPYSRVLKIKEVNHSFNYINLLWPNGVPVSNNSTAISMSMLEVHPRAYKNFMYAKFYKETNGVEYNVLHLRADRDVLIIPIMVNAELLSITTFPTFLNFGMCDISKKGNVNAIRKAIPLSIKNILNFPIVIKNVYTSYIENLITFSFINDNGTLLIQPQESSLYGYAIWNYNQEIFNISEENFASKLYKVTKGSIFIETNYTFSPLSEIRYSYFFDNGKYFSIVSGNEQFIRREGGSPNFLVSTKFKYPIALENKELLNAQNYVLYKDDDLIAQALECPIGFDIIRINVKIENKSLFKNRKFYYLPLKLNFRLHTFVPLRLYNNNLDLLFCTNEEQTFTDCYENQNRIYYSNINYHNEENNPLSIYLNFGMISFEQNKKMYIYLLNENPHTINITDIETDNPSITLDVDNYFELYSNKKYNRKGLNTNQWESHRLSRLLKRRSSNINNYDDKLTVQIFSNCAIKFSIKVFSSYESGIKGHITMFFSDTRKISFIITAGIYKGNLNITPSLIRFDPAFPGLYQQKIINSKSSYTSPINITDITSTDQRIIPIMLTNQISPNNRTEIMKLLFDPSNLSMSERILDIEFSKNKITNNNINSYLTYKELYLWKEKQKLWEKLGSDGRTEINATITITTSIKKEEINVKGFLTKPSLVKRDDIDLGLIQIGDTKPIYIEGFNPSDEMLTYQVLLASEEYSDMYNNSMFNINTKYQFNSMSNNLFKFHCQFYNSSGEVNSGTEEENIILIEETIAFDGIYNGSYSKKELLKKLFLFGNDQIKRNFLLCEKVVCKYDIITKNEIMISRDNFLISEIFSEDFLKEIPIVKEMTEKQDVFMNRNSNYRNGLFKGVLIGKIIQNFQKFFQIEAYNINEKKYNISYSLLNEKNIHHNNQKSKEQDFFLPISLSSRLFHVKPHQKFQIGPVYYHPTNFSTSAVTLFIKNNLTILYPIKLHGKGGSGIAKFMNTRSLSNKNMKLVDNSKMIIEIDKNIFYKEMRNSNNITRTITLSNIGTLSLDIKKMSVEDEGCEGQGIKILQCEKVLLQPDENLDIDLLIRPDFNFYITEKDIYFITDYQKITFKIVININQDILTLQNKLFNLTYINNHGIITVLISIMIAFSVFKLIQRDMYIKSKNNNDVITGEITLYNRKYIDNIEKLKLENLYIKSYRKITKNSGELFITKPENAEIENIEQNQSEKRKIKKKQKNSRNSNNSSASENETKQNKKNDNIIQSTKNITHNEEENSHPVNKGYHSNQEKKYINTKIEERVQSITNAVKSNPQVLKAKKTKDKKTVNKPVGMIEKTEKSTDNTNPQQSKEQQSSYQTNTYWSKPFHYPQVSSQNYYNPHHNKKDNWKNNYYNQSSYNRDDNFFYQSQNRNKFNLNNTNSQMNPMANEIIQSSDYNGFVLPRMSPIYQNESNIQKGRQYDNKHNTSKFTPQGNQKIPLSKNDQYIFNPSSSAKNNINFSNQKISSSNHLSIFNPSMVTEKEIDINKMFLSENEKPSSKFSSFDFLKVITEQEQMENEYNEEHKEIDQKKNEGNVDSGKEIDVNFENMFGDSTIIGSGVNAVGNEDIEEESIGSYNQPYFNKNIFSSNPFVHDEEQRDLDELMGDNESKDDIEESDNDEEYERGDK